MSELKSSKWNGWSMLCLERQFAFKYVLRRLIQWSVNIFRHPFWKNSITEEFTNDNNLQHAEKCLERLIALSHRLIVFMVLNI